RLPLLSIAGGVQSWIVLAAGCDSAAAVVGLLPSLLVLIGLTLVMLAGYASAHIDGRRRGGAAGGSEIAFRHGAFLGLAGHLFLFYIAANPEWSTPPWPLLGSLALLTLAASATSLAAETPPLHAAGALAAAIVVLAWTENGMPGEWATTALVAAVVPAWLAAIAWQQHHARPADWRGVMLLTSALYAVFAAYPFVLDRRARDSRDPHLTAVAGSVFFFFAARSALLQGGMSSVVG